MKESGEERVPPPFSPVGGERGDGENSTSVIE